MKTAEDYRKTWPNKTDDQIIESLGNEVRDKVETIHGLLHDLNDKEWIKQSDQEPTEKDLPFVTWDGTFYDFWEDIDWFQELTEKERLMWTHWMPLQPPKEK